MKRCDMIRGGLLNISAALLEHSFKRTFAKGDFILRMKSPDKLQFTAADCHLAFRRSRTQKVTGLKIA